MPLSRATRSARKEVGVRISGGIFRALYIGFNGVILFIWATSIIFWRSSTRGNSTPASSKPSRICLSLVQQKLIRKPLCFASDVSIGFTVVPPNNCRNSDFASIDSRTYCRLFACLSILQILIRRSVFTAADAAFVPQAKKHWCNRS